MILESNDYRELLRIELQKRCAVNPQYSLRAFSRRLGVPASTLSEVLNKKQGLSKEKALTISKNLNFSALEKDYFVALVESLHGRSKSSRITAQQRVQNIRDIREKDINMENWKIISQWYHTAILELSKTKNFNPDPPAIARRLGITAREVREACERLIRLGMMTRASGKLKATSNSLVKSPHETPSDYIKSFHQSVLTKAALAMYQQPLEIRNYSSLVLAIDDSQIPAAKELIMEFNKKFLNLMTTSDNPNRLYTLSTQFFRLEEEPK